MRKKLVCITLLLISTISYSNEFNYYLQEVWKTQGKNVRVIDIHGDGVDEIASHPWQRELDVLDWRFSTFLISTFVPAPPQTFVGVVPGYYQNSAYLYYHTAHGDSIVYHAMLCGSAKEQHFDLDTDIMTFHRHPDTEAVDFSRQTLSYFSTFRDADDDTLALFRMHTSYDRQGIRGLAAFDLRTFALEWTFLFGPRADKWIIKDANREGADEIFIATSAPFNGICFNDIPDSNAYVICVDANGKLNWKFAAGPFFTACNIDFFTAPGGNQQLFVHRHGGAKNPNLVQDALWLLDSRSGQILNETKTSHITGLNRISHAQVASDFNGDGVDEVVIGMKNGCVKMYNYLLDEIASSQYFGAPVTVEAVADFDGDGLLELAVYVEGKKLVILSNEFEVLCEHDLSSVRLRTVSICRTGHTNHILLSYNENENKLDALMELKKTNIVFATSTQNIEETILLVTAALCLALMIIFFLQKRKYTNLIDRILGLPRIKANSLSLTPKGRILNAGSAWKPLLQQGEEPLKSIFHCACLSADPVQVKRLLAGKQSELNVTFNQNNAIQSFRIERLTGKSDRELLFFLHDKNEEWYVKHLKLWAPTAQRLGHSIKSPLTTVSLTLSDIKKSILSSKNEINGKADDIHEISKQISKIEQLCNDFMRFAKFERPELRQLEIDSFIHLWAEEWRPKNAKIKVHFDLQENLPLIVADERYLKEACHHIFMNALESLQGNGHIKIMTQQVELYSSDCWGKSFFIQLSIHDTGCGIPARYLENITKPYVSTKSSGSGLGLAIVQKNMDMMNGKFDITSSEGMGTTVSLFVPQAP